MPSKKGNKKRNEEPVDDSVEEYQADLYRLAVEYLRSDVKSDKRPHPRKAPPAVKCLADIDLKDLIGCSHPAPMYIMGDPSVEMELAVTLRTAVSACHGTRPKADSFARLLFSVKYLSQKVDIPEFTTEKAVVEDLRDSLKLECCFADEAFVPLDILASHFNAKEARSGLLDPAKSGPCPFGPEWAGDAKEREAFFYAHISCANPTQIKSASFRNFCSHVDAIRLRQNELYAIRGHPLCDPSRCPDVDSYRQLGLKDHHIILLNSARATLEFYKKKKAGESKAKKDAKTDDSDSASAKKANKATKSAGDTESEDEDDRKLDAAKIEADLKDMDASAPASPVKPAKPASKPPPPPPPPTAVAAGAVELGATPAEDVKMEPRKSQPVESDDDAAMVKSKGTKRKAAAATPAAAADESKGAGKPTKQKKQKTTSADFDMKSASKVEESSVDSVVDSLSEMQKRIQKARAAKAASKAAKDEAPAPPPQPSAEENAKRLDIAYGSGAGASAAVAASDDEDVVMLAAAPPARKPVSSAPALAAAVAASPALPPPAPPTPVAEPSLDSMFEIDMSEL